MIVAGGRGLGEPGELRARRGARRRRSAARSPRRARSSTRAGTRTRPRSARPARPSRRSSTSPAASRARSSTRSGCRARARSSRSTRTRTRRSSSSPTSASSATCTQIVPKLTELVRAAQGRVSVTARRTTRRRSTRGEAIAEPTDPADERIEVGVLDRRRRARPGSPARSGSASCSRSDPEIARAARRRAGRGAREGQGARLAPALRRGRQPARRCGGSSRRHARSTRCRSTAQVEHEAVYFLTREARDAHPGAADDAEPRQLRRLALAARPLARRARPRRLGATILPETAARRSCSSRTGASSACAPATRAAAGTARSSPNFEPGSRHRRARHRPRRGHAGPPDRRGARALRARRATSPQVWALGVKEVWKVAEAARPRHPHDGLAAARRASATASSAARSSTRWARTWSRSAWSSASTTATPSSPSTTCSRS